MRRINPGRTPRLHEITPPETPQAQARKELPPSMPRVTGTAARVTWPLLTLITPEAVGGGGK